MSNTSRLIFVALLVSALVLPTTRAQQHSPSNDGRAPATQDWTSISGDLNNTRYSALTQINMQNVKSLKGVWTSQNFDDGATSRVTPVVKDGMMFISAGTHVYGLDAKTGKTVWNYDVAGGRKLKHSAGSATEQNAAKAEGQGLPNGQGMAVGDGTLFVGLTDGNLVALDARTGEKHWTHQIGDTQVKPGQSASAGPAYWNGIVYEGLGDGDYHIRGRITAMDAKTGNELWRFYTVPGPGDFGRNTWPNDDLYKIGGAGVWQIAAVDPDLGMVFFTVGNPTPAYAGEVRPGDNLFTSSVVGVDIKTGKMRWYYQAIHHDIWDGDIPNPLILYDAQVNGQMKKALAIFLPDGYVFMFDRATGKPLIQIEEQPVPQNAFQKTAATQPHAVGADSVLPDCDWWKDKVPAGFVLACMYQPPSMPPPSSDPPNLVAPRTSVRFIPMSYSPQTGFFYIVSAANLEWRRRGDDPFYAYGPVGHVPGLKSYASVAAINSRTNKIAWKKEIPLSKYMRVAPLTTAGGLMFHMWGDGNFQAYDAKTGDVAWEFQTGVGGGLGGAAISYQIDGEQYVALSLGPRAAAFKLNGPLGPRPAPIMPPPNPDPMFDGPITDADTIETTTLDRVRIWNAGARWFINEFEFTPYRTRIKVGTRLTWVNNGKLAQTIQAVDGSWSTGSITPADQASVLFDKPGTYTYIAKEFPWKYGQVIVTSDVAQDGAYSDAQAARGKSLYDQNCSACHLEDLSGTERAPSLAGNTFATHWGQGEVGALYNKISTTMPQTNPGSLSAQDYIDVVAHLLRSNGFPSGHEELKNDVATLQKSIRDLK
jgi:quinohemoprotein ethanol dehydrogenase